MTTCELAINEDGDPFSVPAHVRGWKVRRASERRGRPALIHDGGKPLILRVDATHADLFAAAGPGRYRLEAVDENRRKVEGVPQAWTGPLNEDEDDETTGEDDRDELMAGSTGRRVRMEDVLCQLMVNQTRMVETALGQMGAVMAGVAELLHAAHQTGISTRVPPPSVLPPPAPATQPVEVQEAEDEGEDEPPSVPEAPPSALPEALRLIIERTIDKLVPLIFEKVTSGEGLGGLPLAAILDWRKAMPGARATGSSPPGVASPPAAPIVETAPHAAPAAPTAPAAAVASPAAPTGAYAAHGVTAAPPPAGPASAGAAPSPASPLGAAPASAAPTPASSLTPQELTQEEATALLNAHILQIWQGLNPAERSRASELISGLTDTQRSAWFAELARLTVPEAITRARAVLRAQPPPAPPTHPPQTATPKGDPSS